MTKCGNYWCVAFDIEVPGNVRLLLLGAMSLWSYLFSDTIDNFSILNVSLNQPMVLIMAEVPCIDASFTKIVVALVTYAAVEVSIRENLYKIISLRIAPAKGFF